MLVVKTGYLKSSNRTYGPKTIGQKVDTQNLIKLKKVVARTSITRY